MLRSLLKRVDDVRRLRLLLALLFIALAIPTGVLIWQVQGQLKWEAFHQLRGQAEAMVARVNDALAADISEAEARGFAEYSFLNVTGDPNAGFLQRSALSEFPVEPAIPGLIGYFQVDGEGRFSTPVLPGADTSATSLGIGEDEIAARRALAQTLQNILADNQLAATSPASADLDTQELFDEFRQETREHAQSSARMQNLKPNAGKIQAPETQYSNVNELRLDDALEKKSQVAEEAEEAERDLRSEGGPEAGASASGRSRRVEQSTLPEVLEPLADMADAPSPAAEVRITTFESEVDPFEFARLGSGEYVLYRNAWRGGDRLIQGMLIDPDRFLQQAIVAPYSGDRISADIDLAVALGDLVIHSTGGEGDLLYRRRLASPVDAFELIFSVSNLPAGPGSRILGWTSALLALVFGLGFWILYRLGLGQIRLARQQQDFVAAVSHELKTPLTSIRMYSEMLKEGWTDEARRQQYYAFIHDESERLSRLISNVLQLASITRNEPSLDLRQVSAAHLLDSARSRIARQVESAGFGLEIGAEGDMDNIMVEVDEDCVMQIVINLVDNAIKFSAAASTKKLEITAALQGDSSMRFSVRDYGPGIPKDQIRKIFRLFYRPRSELTRETVGTGIGLAIVHQLTTAMGGRVDVLNRDPGAEFGITFPVLKGRVEG